MAQHALQAKGVSEFIAWTWDMVNAGHPEIGWSEDGSLVVVSNAERLAEHLLPKYFRHGQYASWVRALNAYDFKKSGAGRWHHPSFVRGSPELLPNIRRKAPPSRSGGGGSGGSSAAVQKAAATSTALVPRRKRAPASPDLETTQQLWFMQRELERLQGEVGALRTEEFQQRFDTVRLMQVMLAQLTHKPSSSNEAKIVLNPAVITAHAPLPNQLTYKEDLDERSASGRAGSSTASSGGSGKGSSGGKAGGGSPALVLDLPQINLQPSEGAESHVSLPPLQPAGPSFDIAALDLGGDGPMSPGTMRQAPPLFDAPAAAVMPDSPPIVEEDAMLHAHDAPMAVDGAAPLEDGLLAVSTSDAPASPPRGVPRATFGAAAGEHSHQMLSAAAANAAAANIIGALATNSAASATALQFANVLARMPPLPASTAQLPPQGTVQRQHIEAAIELAFRQLSITATQALAGQQQQT